MQINRIIFSPEEFDFFVFRYTLILEEKCFILTRLQSQSDEALLFIITGGRNNEHQFETTKKQAAAAQAPAAHGIRVFGRRTATRCKQHQQKKGGKK
jgi:hypothetical protein